jgi:hypothetical protein
MYTLARNRRHAAIALLILGFTAGCRFEDPTDREVEQHSTDAQPAASATAPADGTNTTAANGGAPMDWATLQARVTANADSADRMLRKVRALTRVEQTLLRRDVNAVQINRARQLGIARNSNIEELARAGRLVRLEESTKYWTLYRLNFSVPYVTPSTEALLAEIGERFQKQLDSLKVPRYRLVITSALRTADKQAALRRANSNASKVESAHEFGTTVDIAYRRFAAPLDGVPAPHPSLGGRDLMFNDSIMSKTANARSAELQAVLGRVLQQMKREGKVMVMMERRQTVYHITLARPYPNPRHVEAST